MTDPNQIYEEDEKLGMPYLETYKKQPRIDIVYGRNIRGEDGDIFHVHTYSKYHKKIPHTNPTNIWPETSSDTELTSTTNSDNAMPEHRSITEYTSVSTDNIDLAWMTNLQLQV